MINVFYFTCNFCVKMGLLQMYRKFTLETWGKASILFAEVTSVCFWIGSVFATAFQCVPLSAVWNPKIAGWCIDIKAFYVSNAIIMIAMDMVLYAMPIIFTWHLNFTPSKRLGLRILFGLGFV